jgi:hypothetical protein
MRGLSYVLFGLLAIGCKGATDTSSVPGFASKVTVLKGLSPTKTIPSSTGGSGLARYELKQSADSVLGSIRKDAATGGWREEAPMGHPVFIVATPGSIANVDVEAGKLSTDGLSIAPDPGTTVVTVSEVKTAG